MVVAFALPHWLLRRGRDAIYSIASVVGATGGICVVSRNKIKLKLIKMREDVSVRGGRRARRQAICEM